MLVTTTWKCSVPRWHDLCCGILSHAASVRWASFANLFSPTTSAAVDPRMRCEERDAVRLRDMDHVNIHLTGIACCETTGVWSSVVTPKGRTKLAQTPSFSQSLAPRCRLGASHQSGKVTWSRGHQAGLNKRTA